MDTNIHQLLEKYFEGATSIQEEKQLNDYFSQDQIEEDLKVYRALFQYNNDLQQEELLPSFDEQLLDQLSQQKPTRRISINRRWMAYAASVAILVFALFQFQGQNQVGLKHELIVQEGEIEDPEIAFEQAKVAFKFLSGKLNKGSKKASTEFDNIQKVSKIFK